jgi:plasmid stabilization system protein ParE
VLAVRFTEAARTELIEAQDWYEAQAPGLGRRFRAEIDDVVQRMADNPRQFPVIFKKVRRARATRFPYALFFLVEADALLVIACFHGSRDPRQWQKRV